jgi:dolichyl-phosphate beta-glucosyltransferase
MPRTTIVVPCYNEADRLDVRAFRDFIGRTIGLRFLFVNDGSTDETLRVLESLAAEAPRHFAVLDLPQNVGKAEAVRHGILRALGDGAVFVGFLDADLATPLDALPGLCRVLENNPEVQIVLGSRVRLLGRRIERRPMRHYLGRIFATAASCVLGLPVYDTQCGAKLFRACAEVGLLFEEPFRTRWIFDVELLARFVQARYVAGERPAEEAIVEVPLMEWHDVAGSKIRARDFVKAVFELTRIHRTYRCRASRVPTTTEPAAEEEPARPKRRKVV